MIELTPTSGGLKLEDRELPPELRRVLDRTPDGWYHRDGAVYFTDSVDNRDFLARHLGEVTFPREPALDQYTFRTEPYAHQLKALKRSLERPAFGYLMEMGTGKTKVLIDNAAYLYERKLIDGLVVVAPNGVHRQFVTEQLPTHLPERVPTLEVVYQSGAGVKLKHHLDQLAKPQEGKMRVLGINVEALSHSSGERYLERVLSSGRFLLAVDESSTIKTPSARRTKVLLRLAPKAPFRRILTGSPITKGVEDLYTQLRFLHPSIIGLRSFYAYRNRYCVTAPIPGAPDPRARRVVDYKNLDELQNKMAPYVHRVRKEECLDLPPKVYVTREVELHLEQRRLYRELKDELLTELEDGTVITAQLAIVKLMRLQQVTCGHLPKDPERGETAGWRPIPARGKLPRIEAVRELVAETSGPVIVWGRFRADLDLLERALAEHGTARYDGTVGRDDRYKAIQDWRGGRARVFLGQPATAGLGLNLVGAHTVIYYSNSFDAEHRWQSEDRAHRMGTVDRVTYVDLVAENTLDARIRQALTRKENIANMTLSGIRSLLDEDR